MERVINEIEFKQTSNIFLNSGIIGLYIYLNKHKKDDTLDYDFNFKLEKNHLKITSDNLFKLLEDVYYKMGKDYYDISNKKQQKEKDKYFFVREPFNAEPFGKMTSYGLSGLITKPPFGPQPVPRKEEDGVYFKNLIEEDIEFSNKVSKFYFENQLSLKFYDFDKDGKFIYNKDQNKGDSRIFLNEPYTKTTTLPDFDDKYFELGDNECYLTGEKYKKLVDSVSTSPFIAGLSNFESFGKLKARNISWKAMYLSRFSPVLCLYSYIGAYEQIVCYFFNSNNLENLNELFKINQNFFMTKEELLENDFRSNFKIWNFYSLKKDNNSQFTDKNDYVLESENVFVLLYTFYRQFLFNNGIEEPEEKDEHDLENIFNELPVNLIYFRSDKFSETMRPSIFDYFNQFKFIIYLFIETERKKIHIGKILSYLKFIKESERTAAGHYQIERKLRNEICYKILNTKSIIKEILLLFYNAFLQMMSGDFERFRNYNDLLKLLKIYEKLINYGGNQFMNEELQEKAVGLGSFIGIGIINYNNPKNENEKKDNIKSGRKYIISLNKSRTIQQYLDELIRIQNKYGIIVSKDILSSINENNWEYIKRFCLISALNLINGTLKPFDKNNNIEGVKK
jgi:hypothetical protein